MQYKGEGHAFESRTRCGVPFASPAGYGAGSSKLGSLGSTPGDA
jgi:hypothetical protein